MKVSAYFDGVFLCLFLVFSIPILPMIIHPLCTFWGLYVVAFYGRTFKGSMDVRPKHLCTYVHRSFERWMNGGEHNGGRDHDFGTFFERE